jgi:SulP family sulfate permease
VLVTTFILTVVVDLVVAIQVGVVLSAILFMKRMSDIANFRTNNIIDSDIIEDYSEIPKSIGIYEISGPLFFASARRYSEIIEELAIKRKILIIRMRHVSFIDQTGLHNLKDTIKILKKQGVLVILSGVNSDVMKDLEKTNIITLINSLNVFDSFETALLHAKESSKKEKYTIKPQK